MRPVGMIPNFTLCLFSQHQASCHTDALGSEGAQQDSATHHFLPREMRTRRTLGVRVTAGFGDATCQINPSKALTSKLQSKARPHGWVEARDRLTPPPVPLGAAPAPSTHPEPHPTSHPHPQPMGSIQRTWAQVPAFQLQGSEVLNKPKPHIPHPAAFWLTQASSSAEPDGQDQETFPSYLRGEAAHPACPWGTRLAGKARLCSSRQPHPTAPPSLGLDPASNSTQGRALPRGTHLGMEGTPPGRDNLGPPRTKRPAASCRGCSLFRASLLSLQTPLGFTS